MPTSNIQAIVVYKATGIGAAPTAGCLTGSVSGTCNFYTASKLTQTFEPVRMRHQPSTVLVPHDGWSGAPGTTCDATP